MKEEEEEDDSDDDQSDGSVEPETLKVSYKSLLY